MSDNTVPPVPPIPPAPDASVPPAPPAPPAPPEPTPPVPTAAVPTEPEQNAYAQPTPPTPVYGQPEQPAPGYVAPGYVPQQPGYVPQQTGYGQPGYGEQPPVYGQPAGYSAYSAYPAAPPKGLAITSMALGIGAFVTMLFGLGFFAAIGAIITGFMARKQQPYARGFWLTGLIGGFVTLGLLIAIFVFCVVVIVVSSAQSPYDY